MIKSNSKTRRRLLKLCMAFLFPLALFSGIGVSYNPRNQVAADYVASYETTTTVTNSSFTQGSIASASNSLTGWSAIETESKATGMIVDVGSGTSSDPDTENQTFSIHQSTYMLEQNPGSNGSDNRILMINSKAKSTQSNILARKGYRSNTITLDANSYYRFSVAVKTSTNGDESVNASVYVSGIKDVNNENIQIGYENIINSVWKEYFIFVATGNKSQSVTIDLYLGSANGQSSYGAVFFDEVYASKLSQNAFFESCYEKGYNNVDDYKNFETSKTKFLINDLLEEKNLIDTTDYNFDFEDVIIPDTNTLGDDWTVVSKSNGHAIISDIKNMQASDFKEMTGYDYVGTDLSYNNNQALVLYTKDNDGHANGYIGVKSKDIEIQAHEIYKVSMNIKVSQISSGSFYFKVQENDKIYTLYPEILSDNSDEENYYELQSSKTSGISSNTTNKFTNDYRTATLYIKGHSLYNTSVNIELWLGDENTNAQGCVVVDNIIVEYSDYSSFNSASDKLEFKSFSSSPSTIANGYFNATEDDEANGLYPIKATGWTSEVENEKNNVNGVVYLYDETTYKNMYVGNYSWAGIYPGSPRNSNITTPNNVYMMFNKQNSYQSVKSSSYTLNSNSYYKLSFDYFTQDFSGLNSAKIKVDVIDENGITIYSKSNLSTHATWGNMDIIFHTALTVSHNVSVKVSLGDENEKCGGLVYLDNFIFAEADEDDFSSANFKANLDDYYLNLNEENLSSEISTSSAYNLTVDEIYDSSYSSNDTCANGGIVSGQNNSYMTINQELQLKDGNYLVLSTKVASKTTLTSVYKMNLESGKYYKLTFKLATIFNQIDGDDFKYGARVGLKGFEETELLTTNNELNSYTIYLKCEDANSSNILFTLVSDNTETIGTALLTDINFAEVEENDYNNALLSPSLNKSIFTANQTQTEDKEEDVTEDVTEDETNENTNSSGNTWLLIPSIITAVAVVIGIAGWALRNVKIKKIEKIKKENYDRKLATKNDDVLDEAQKRRDKEIGELENAKKSFEDEIVKIEEEHKEYFKEKKVQSNGKLTKEMERTFKSFNTKRHALEEKINIVNEKIANVSTAEYLLTIQRKILAERDEKYAQEKKEQKQKN